jgi:hypothetical protein
MVPTIKHQVTGSIPIVDSCHINCQPFSGAAGSAIDVGTFPAQSIRNPTYNKAFEDAAKAFALQCPFDSATFSFRGNVIVKLSTLHPIFECLSFPIRGFHLKMTLFFNNPSWQPFVCVNGAAAVMKNWCKWYRFIAMYVVQ